MDAHTSSIESSWKQHGRASRAVPLPVDMELLSISDPVLPLPAVRSLEKRRLQCYLAIMLADIVAILLGFSLGSIAIFGLSLPSHALTQAQLMLPLFLTLALYNRAYSVAALANTAVLVGKALQSLALAGLAMVLLNYIAGTSSTFSRVVFTSGMMVSALTLPAIRGLMQGFVRWRCGDRVENVLIVDAGGPKVEVPEAFCVDADSAGLKPDIGDPLAVDRLGAWFAPMDRVLVSCPEEARVGWAMALKGLAVEGEVIDERVEEMGALGARRAGGQGFLRVSHRPLGLRDRAIKRALDLVVTVPAILLLSPLLLAVAILIRLDDRGPAIFAQKRTGRSSRFFTIYKFRTMRIAASDEHGAVSASRNDSRLTRIGSFLRRTSIDELPQLLNVLKGDMSLVGPRPHAPGSQAGEKLFWEVDGRYWQRHTLKPGLTGLAQIRGFRGATETETDLVNRLQADLEYLHNWSLWTDIGILIATCRVVVHDRAF
ncbi:sugar transferase [Croceicoccus sp. BE223]|uniref:sugar transferase n=1 Tax=Croceicoccus sp. BE223 TaxID=2817716 RepID=UPI002857EAF8|nr:sugar transferase [Croceicoccus sp. BE223]MDR7102067.1 lipopolysaccharide/colanic/teichoic acid biosynthesis glycosyltransferase [Croceicoccus sp. BE223]